MRNITSPSSSSPFNFEAFLDTLNQRRAGPDGSSRHMELVRRFVFALAQQPKPEGAFVMELSRQHGVDESYLKDLVEELVRHEFIEREGSMLALTPFARKALGYFSVA